MFIFEKKVDSTQILNLVYYSYSYIITKETYLLIVSNNKKLSPTVKRAARQRAIS